MKAFIVDHTFPVDRATSLGMVKHLLLTVTTIDLR